MFFLLKIPYTSYVKLSKNHGAVLRLPLLDFFPNRFFFLGHPVVGEDESRLLREAHQQHRDNFVRILDYVKRNAHRLNQATRAYYAGRDDRQHAAEALHLVI